MPQPSTAALSPQEVLRFRKKLLAWFQVHARNLPWRGIVEPYHTWVSEIMLQQTRVNAVIDHYNRFLARFPTVVSLALAPESDVLALWSGLGYYRRARMLHKAAQFLLQEHKGILPSTAVALRTLPGVGEYTSAAIASIAFGEQIAVVDGNVERVLLRVTGRGENASKTTQDFLRQQAQSLVPRRSAGDHNQAMMELGATICLPRAPLCLDCPVYNLCRTRGEHNTLPRTKMRSERIAFGLALRKNGTATEVLLQKRETHASLMPDMLELPQLTLDDSPAGQPILRVRHSITTTNYYVEVYGIGGSLESIAASREETDLLHDLSGEEDAGLGDSAQQIHLLATTPAAMQHRHEDPGNDDAEVVEASLTPEQKGNLPHLLSMHTGTEVDADLQWVRAGALSKLPLTGLARKILHRLDVMPAPLTAAAARKAQEQVDNALIMPPPEMPAKQVERSARSAAAAQRRRLAKYFDDDRW